MITQSRPADALPVTGEAVAIRRDRYQPDLARSLNNRSSFLSDLGRREEALAVGEEALGLSRQLARVRPDVFLPDLARSLNNQSGRLSELGRRGPAPTELRRAWPTGNLLLGDLVADRGRGRPSSRGPACELGGGSAGQRGSALVPAASPYG